MHQNMKTTYASHIKSGFGLKGQKEVINVYFKFHALGLKFLLRIIQTFNRPETTRFARCFRDAY